MQLWEQFLSTLEKEIGADTVERWLRPLKVVRFDAANIYLEAKDRFQVHWYQEHLQKRLAKIPLLNPNGRRMKIHLKLSQTLSEDSLKKESSEKNSSFAVSFDPTLSFDEFIPIEENRVLLEILQNLETSPFNPIYLYGPSNAGKSHLLSATALALQKKGKKAIYKRADHFTEEVIQAMRSGQMREFRQIYRSVDLLCIDNVDLFSRKFATQEEFFHTFNDLHTAGKSILLASRLPPFHLSEIEPRLISRFEWGLSLPVVQIDLEKILEKKAKNWNLPLAPTLIAYLLKTFSSNALIALTALSVRMKGKEPITIPVAEKLLYDLIDTEKKEAWTPEKILKKVADHYGVLPTDLIAKTKAREIVFPRQVAIYLCRQILQLPYQKIGAIFGRDHSTIMASVNQIKEKIEDKEGELVQWLHKEFTLSNPI